MAFEQDQFEYVDNISFNTSSWIVNTVYNYRHFESKATDFFSFCNAIDSQIQKLKQALMVATIASLYSLWKTVYMTGLLYNCT